MSLKIINKLTGDIIEEFADSEQEKAYQKLLELENWGLDLSLEAPTLMDSLANAIQLSDRDSELFHQSLQEEIEDHEGHEADE